MSLNNDSGPLNLSGFAEWARTNGGPLQRNEKGQLRTRRAKIREATIRQDVRILQQFGYTMNREIRKRERTELGDVAGGEAEINFAIPYFVMEMEQRELAPATQERYLVAVRRYLRFETHRQVQVGRVRGPYIPPKGRTTMLHPDDLNRWLDSLEDDRIEIASWLALARVPVGKIAELAYGREIRVGDGAIELVVDKTVWQLPETLEHLLVAASEGGRRRGPLFLSKSPRHEEPGMLAKKPISPWKRAALSTSGLGHLWAATRKSLDPPGPTMSELAVVGRNVTLRREDGAWIYVPRPEQLNLRTRSAQAT